MNKKFSIGLIIPSRGVKPFVVLESLLEEPCIDWNNSFIITDDTIAPSDVRSLLENHDIRIITCEEDNLEPIADELNSLAPDFLISCGWGSKIASSVITASGIASLNCHSSYLPDYKGLSVYKHYWANIEPMMGATIHLLTDDFDTGAMVCRHPFRIFTHDTPQSLLYRASEMTAAMIPTTMFLLDSGYKGIPQKGGRYFYRISYGKLYLYRFYNRIASALGLPRRLTPHKVLNNA